MELFIYTLCYSICFILGGIVSGGIRLPKHEEKAAAEPCKQEDKLSRELAMLLSYNGNKREEGLDENRQ